jgi:hypothetical protein
MTDSLFFKIYGVIAYTTKVMPPYNLIETIIKMRSLAKKHLYLCFHYSTGEIDTNEFDFQISKIENKINSLAKTENITTKFAYDPRGSTTIIYYLGHNITEALWI